MTKYFLIIFLFFGLQSFGQTLDTIIYRQLFESKYVDFIDIAKSHGYSTSIDTVNNFLTAKTNGVIFFKEKPDTGTTEYRLDMIVSTLNKENNKLILKNAKLIDEKANMWQDDKYLYREWDVENVYTKVMWYKVLVYVPR